MLSLTPLPKTGESKIMFTLEKQCSNCWNYRFNSEEARAIDRLQLDMYNEIRQVHIIPDHDSSENQMRKNDNKLPEGICILHVVEKR